MQRQRRVSTGGRGHQLTTGGSDAALLCPCPRPASSRLPVPSIATVDEKTWAEGRLGPSFVRSIPPSPSPPVAGGQWLLGGVGGPSPPALSSHPHSLTLSLSLRDLIMSLDTVQAADCPFPLPARPRTLHSRLTRLRLPNNVRRESSTVQSENVYKVCGILMNAAKFV